MSATLPSSPRRGLPWLAIIIVLEIFGRWRIRAVGHDHHATRPSTRRSDAPRKRGYSQRRARSLYREPCINQIATQPPPKEHLMTDSEMPELYNLDLSTEELVSWIRLTTPNDDTRARITMMLREYADILEDELRHESDAECGTKCGTG